MPYDNPFVVQSVGLPVGSIVEVDDTAWRTTGDPHLGYGWVNVADDEDVTTDRVIDSGLAYYGGRVVRRGFEPEEVRRG